MFAFAEGSDKDFDELETEGDNEVDEGEILGKDYGVWTWPVQGQKPLSNVIQHMSDKHGAIDITGAEGTTIVAAKDGTVMTVVNDCTHKNVGSGVCVHKNSSGTVYDGGNTVRIDHGDGVYSTYSHMQKERYI